MDLLRNLNYGQPVNWAHPHNDGLLAWWAVLPNWLGGGTLPDLVGLAPLTLNNMDDAAWSAQETQFGLVPTLFFDGTDDYARASFTALGGLSACTVEILALLDSTFTDTTPTMVRGEGKLFIRRRHDNGKLTFWLDTSAGIAQFDSTTVMALDSPTHIACRYDGANITMVVNGNLDATSKAQTGTIDLFTDFDIGAFGTTPINVWKGPIFHVRVYDRAIDVEEARGNNDLLRRPDSQLWNISSLYTPGAGIPDATQFISGWTRRKKISIDHSALD